MMSFLKHSICLVLVSFIFAFAVWVLHPGMPDYSDGRLSDGGILLSQISEADSVLWLDARTEVEYQEDHIPEALLLTLEDFNDQIAAVMDVYDPSIPVIVYCSEEKCQTSRKVAEILKDEFEMQNVYFLEGGWEAWKEAHK